MKKSTLTKVCWYSRPQKVSTSGSSSSSSSSSSITRGGIFHLTDMAACYWTAEAVGLAPATTWWAQIRAGGVTQR